MPLTTIASTANRNSANGATAIAVMTCALGQVMRDAIKHSFKLARAALKEHRKSRGNVGGAPQEGHHFAVRAPLPD